MTDKADTTELTNQALPGFVQLANSWQLRFDLRIDPEHPEIAKQFARAWAEQLENQRLTSIIGSKYHPTEVRLQVCMQDGFNICDESIQQVVSILNTLWKSHLGEVSTECLPANENDWQGFILWLTFDREKAEEFFTKKAKRRFSRFVFKRLYSAIKSEAA